MGCGKDDDCRRTERHSKNCICEVVRAIKDIQDMGANDDCNGCSTSCFMEPLGGIVLAQGGESLSIHVFSCY